MSWRTNGTRVEDADGRVVAYLTPWSTEADARKIAAVDDMLAALKLAMSGGFACPTHVEEIMLAAIAQAEGK